jgi:adenylate cyclase
MSFHADVIFLPHKPTPPPKLQPPRAFGFSKKPSFPSFTMNRQPSTSNLTLSHRISRPSEAPSLTESTRSSTSTEMASSDQGPGLRKAKSSINVFTQMIKKSRSRTRLRADSETKRGGKLQRAPPVPILAQESYVSLLPMPPSPPPTWSKGSKSRTKTKDLKDLDGPPPLPPKEPEFTLDTNLDQMDGIVDMAVFSANQDIPSSPGTTSGFDSAFSHSSETSLPQSSSPVNSMFSNPNPFSQSPTAKRKPPRLTIDRKVSPKTIHPPATIVRVVPPQSEQPKEFIDRDLPDSPSWIPPESWAVEKEGEEMEPEYSSSEESVHVAGSRPLSQTGPSVHKRKSRRKAAFKPKPPPGHTTYRVRINRTNGSYHVASISLDTTVAQLTPLLNHKLLLESEREVHKLYLKERGRGE